MTVSEITTSHLPFILTNIQLKLFDNQIYFHIFAVEITFSETAVSKTNHTKKVTYTA